MHLNASIADLEALISREPNNKTFAKELKTSQKLLQEKGGKVVSQTAVKDPAVRGPLPPQDIGLKEGKTTKRSHCACEQRRHHPRQSIFEPDAPLRRL